LLSDEEAFARFARTRFDALIGYQYYGWPLPAAIVASHLMTWFFVFDDQMDMDHALDDGARRFTLELAQRHLEILAGARPNANDSNLIVAFDDLLSQVRRLGAGGHERWNERFVHHLGEYVHGTLWEGTFGATTAERTNTAMYLQVRHLAVGVAPCHDLMAIAAGITPTGLDGNPYIERLERLAINYSIWVNDLAGLNRDQKRGLANVVFTLRNDLEVPLAFAAQMVGRFCDGELHAFVQLEQQLPTLLGENWQRHRAAFIGYRHVLRRWMRGLLDWSATSERYRWLNEDMSLQTERSIQDAARGRVTPPGRAVPTRTAR
jgi:hypothetical protein